MFFHNMGKPITDNFGAKYWNLPIGKCRNKMATAIYVSDWGISTRVTTFVTLCKSVYKLKISHFIHQIKEQVAQKTNLYALWEFIFYFSSHHALTFHENCITLGCRNEKAQVLQDSLESQLIGYAIFKYANDHVFVACLFVFIYPTYFGA